jgi:hypothetical protein
VDTEARMSSIFIVSFVFSGVDGFCGEFCCWVFLEVGLMEGVCVDIKVEV